MSEQEPVYESPRFALGDYPDPPGRYERVGALIGKLVDRKQAAYGQSFDRCGRVLLEMYPTGIQPAQYDDLLAIVRVLDKLFRIAKNPRALGESPWTDIAGYALLKNKDYSEDGHEEKQ